MSQKLRPMLAAVFEPSLVRYPVIVQPKLDGIRAIVKEGTAYSRTLKPIRNEFIQQVIREHSELLEGVDGELMIGSPVAEDVYRQTTSGVMTQSGEPPFSYYVFDLWNHPDEPYTKRLATLTSRNLPPEWCLVIEQTWAMNEHELLEAHRKYVSLGYEGTILRGPLTKYKYNRSTAREGALLKFKDFVDAEAVIIGFEEKMHNANPAELDERGFTKRSSHQENKIPMATLGALVVSMALASDTTTFKRPLAPTVTFKIGTGFDDSLRQQIWNDRGSLMGRTVKFKYFPGGAYDAPRFPVFLGFRDPIDTETSP